MKILRWSKGDVRVGGERTRRVVSAFVAASVLSMGCASLPPTGTPATGGKLGVEYVDEHYQYTVKEKVGEVEHRDGNGQKLGTSAVYENRTVNAVQHKWYPTQDGSRIDDQDFFRIAGDKENAERIAEHRDGGVTMNHVGFGLLLAGAAMLVGGYVARTNGAPGTRPDGTLDDGDPTLTNVGTGLGIGGALSAIVGGTLVYAGLNRVDPERHAIDEPSLAEQRARQYNERLGTANAVEDDADETPSASRAPVETTRHRFAPAIVGSLPARVH